MIADFEPDWRLDQATIWTTMNAFGSTGLSVSPLALAGNFGIRAEEVERAFHELGINTFFVTPRMTQAVEGIRRLVDAGHRERLVIITVAPLPTSGSVHRTVDKTARVLGLDTVDVLLLGWVRSRWYPSGKTWPAMQQLKASGRVRALGISCHNRPLARELVDELDLDVLMIRYNAAHRGAEREIFATLPEGRRPAVISYTATRWGGLLKPAKGLGPMDAAECYRFPLMHSSVDTVLCGPKNFEQLKHDLVGVETGAIAEPRLSEILAFGDAVRASATSRLGFGRS